jgi:hypothetical protein
MKSSPCTPSGVIRDARALTAERMEQERISTERAVAVAAEAQAEGRRQSRQRRPNESLTRSPPSG